MISFRPTEEETAFIEVAEDFAKHKIRPLAQSMDENPGVVEDAKRQLEELGLINLELPEKWNGLALPLITQVQLMKALSYGDLDFIQSLPGAGDAASIIRLLPENEPIKTFKNKFLSSEQNTVAFIESSPTGEAVGSSLQIERDGEDFILNGRTLPTRLAKTCSHIILSVHAADEQLLLYLDRSNDWKVEDDNRLGLNTSGIASLTFHQVSVAKEQVLARGDVAEKIVTNAKTRIQILQAAKEVGLAEAALDYATEYTAGRKAFGQEIAKFQGVSFRIAQMAIELRAANHLVLDAALHADKDHPKAEALALRALHRAHRAVRFNTDSAVQLLGGHGFIREYPVEKWMRDAQAQIILYGRERDLLMEYGKRLVEEKKDVGIV